MFGFEISQLIILIVVICLVLWRFSYGFNNGLFAEAAGLVAVIASFAAAFYCMKLIQSVVNIELGGIMSKIGSLALAVVIYKIMTAIADNIRKVKDIPIVGNADRFFGGILGVAEAAMIILIVEYITDIQIISTFWGTCKELMILIQKSF